MEHNTQSHIIYTGTYHAMSIQREKYQVLVFRFLILIGISYYTVAMIKATMDKSL